MVQRTGQTIELFVSLAIASSPSRTVPSPRMAGTKPGHHVGIGKLGIRAAFSD